MHRAAQFARSRRKTFSSACNMPLRNCVFFASRQRDGIGFNIDMDLKVNMESFCYCNIKEHWLTQSFHGDLNVR